MGEHFMYVLEVAVPVQTEVEGRVCGEGLLGDLVLSQLSVLQLLGDACQSGSHTNTHTMALSITITPWSKAVTQTQTLAQVAEAGDWASRSS